jgi:hypothetical protein
MSKKDILKRLKVLSDQLELIHQYEKDFLKIEGRENRIDAILDEMNELNKQLKKWS